MIKNCKSKCENREDSYNGFKNKIEDYFKHHSFSSMGIDATDLNGDGKSDVIGISNYIYVSLSTGDSLDFKEVWYNQDFMGSEL